MTSARSIDPVFILIPSNNSNEALESKQHYQHQLTQAGFKQITTEIMPASEFYYAEDIHQQYLAKNPQGYCGLGGLGVIF